MTQNRNSGVRVNVKRFFIAIGILSVLVFVIGLIFGRSLGGGGKVDVTTDLIKGRLETLGEVTSLDYNYKHVGKMENTSPFYGTEIDSEAEEILVSFDGSIKAGVDLKESVVTVEDKTIKLKLPEARIISHSIIEDTISLLNENTKTFAPLNIVDMVPFITEQKIMVEKEFNEKPLMMQANESAKQMVRSFLLSDQKTFEGYEIVFE